MSGPKVVRIVTREEMEAHCTELIHRVELVGENLRRFAGRQDLLTSQVENSIQGSIDGLKRLFDEERWTDLQMQVPVQEEFLRSEMKLVEAEAIARAEAFRSRQRHVGDSARSLISALRASGQSIPTELEEAARSAARADASTLPKMEMAITQGFATLRKLALGAPPLGQNELAARLGKGETFESMAEWMKANKPSTVADDRLDRLIAQLQVLADEDTTIDFVTRAEEIARHSLESDRALLTDSLILDITATIQAQRRKETAITLMSEVRHQLNPVTAETRDLATQLDIAIASANESASGDLLTKARAAISAQRSASASIARRRVVLKGLAALGYEIREHMETAWVESGKIVVRKAGSFDYGVELGATPDAALVQMRVVGAEQPVEPRSVERDRDAEVLWCADFAELRAAVSAGGSDMHLERAVVAGIEPVKTVILENEGNVASTDASGTMHQEMRRT